jgi:hypothetical protein
MPSLRPRGVLRSVDIEATKYSSSEGIYSTRRTLARADNPRGDNRIQRYASDQWRGVARIRIRQGPIDTPIRAAAGEPPCGLHLRRAP